MSAKTDNLLEVAFGMVNQAATMLEETTPDEIRAKWPNLTGSIEALISLGAVCIVLANDQAEKLSTVANDDHPN